MPTAPGSTPLLVGREREQTLLRDRLSDAFAGRGGLVLISGEAGIGKTTLAETVCREAAARSVLVLVGRCYDLAETPPMVRGSNSSAAINRAAPCLCAQQPSSSGESSAR